MLDFLGKSSCGLVNVLVILSFMLCWPFIKQIEAITVNKKFFFKFVSLVFVLLGDVLMCWGFLDYPKKGGVHIFPLKREGLGRAWGCFLKMWVITSLVAFFAYSLPKLEVIINLLDVIRTVGRTGDRIVNGIYFQRDRGNIQRHNTYKLRLDISTITVTDTIVKGRSKNKEWR